MVYVSVRPVAYRSLQVAQFVAELIMQCFRDKSKVSAVERQGKLDEKSTVDSNSNSSSGAAVATAPEIGTKTALGGPMNTKHE